MSIPLDHCLISQILRSLKVPSAFVVNECLDGIECCLSDVVSQDFQVLSLDNDDICQQGYLTATLPHKQAVNDESNQ